eukprot:jgi/Tetstr1/440173/TSEL_028527.t1
MRAGEKSKTGGGDKASADHIHVSVELGRTESMAALSSVKSFLQVASRDAPPTLVCSRGSVAEVYSKLAVRTKTAELERTLEESEPQAQWYHAACNLVSMHKAKQTPPHRIPRIALLTHAGPVTAGIALLMDRFTAIGVVMAAYGINVVLLEIQSTLATPPKTIGLEGGAAWTSILANCLFIFDSVGSTQLLLQPLLEEAISLAWAALALKGAKSSAASRYPRLVSVGTGFLLVGILAILAIAIPNLTTALGIVTAVALIPTTFITPPLIHLKLTDGTAGALAMLDKICCYVLMVVGVIMGLLGLVGTLYDISVSY